MQLPSRYEPLHCAAPVPVYAMHVYLFVSISCSDFLSVFSFFIYIYTHLYLFIYINVYYIYIYIYICFFKIYTPIFFHFLYLSRTFLAHVLRPNSSHRCSSFTSHCRSFTSLPQKRLRRHARAFHFPACFQVQLTYFRIHVTFSFRSPPPGPQVKREMSMCMSTAQARAKRVRGSPARHFPFKRALMTCSCTFRLRRLARNGGRGISVLHFPV